jgi:hypothetical protein
MQPSPSPGAVISAAFQDLPVNLGNPKVHDLVRFDVFTAVTMKNVVFCDIKPSSYFTGDTLFLRHRVQLVNSM